MRTPLGYRGPSWLLEMCGATACYLTCLPAGLLLRFFTLEDLADVVAHDRPAVLRAIRAAGSGPGGFRRAGGNGQVLADTAKPTADAGGGKAAGWAGPLPGQPDIGGEVAGEVQLGVGGDDEPGPAVGGGRVPQFGRVQPRVCPRNRNVRSISKRRRNACQDRFTPSSVAAARADHSQTGSASRHPGRWPTCSRMRVPSTTGSSPSWSSQLPRCSSRR